MTTTDYTKPYRDEFRITKTDVKKALRAAITSNVYKLNNEFQKVLDYVYSSIHFKVIRRLVENGEVTSIMPVYEICHTEVTFHKVTKPISLVCYASQFENTTSDDFIYTLMNTLIPVLIQDGCMTRVLDIDAFED